MNFSSKNPIQVKKNSILLGLLPCWFPSLSLPLRARALPLSVFRYSGAIHQKHLAFRTYLSSAMSAIIVLVRVAGLSGFS